MKFSSFSKMTAVILLVLFFHLPVFGQKKIVSLAPHITEMIFKMGAAEQLIGRTQFCSYPESTRKIEILGGYLDVNLEKLFALKPELVFQFPNEKKQRQIEKLGMEVITVPNETIEQILDGILLVGQHVNRNVEAKKLRQGIVDTLNLVKRSSDISGPNALILVGRELANLNGLYAAGKTTYLSEIWELCGGQNAFADVDNRYFAISKEELLRRKIDVVIELHPHWQLDDGALKNEIQLWKKLSTQIPLDASNVRILNDQMYLIPGPRISKIAMEFSKIYREVASLRTKERE